MANELKVETRWKYVKNGVTMEHPPVLESITVAGADHARYTKTCDTTAKTILSAGLAFGGRMMLLNLSSTVSVYFDFTGLKDDNIILAPGEKMELRVNAGQTMYAYTAASTADIEVTGVDA